MPYGDHELNLVTPLPGTYLYAQCLRDGSIKDKVEYMMRLERGYNLGAPVLINLTKFSNEELLRLQNEIQEKIYNNYKRYLARDPIILTIRIIEKLIMSVSRDD